MQPRVRVEDVWQGYRYKTKHGARRRGEMHWVVRGVSLQANPGELLGIVGGNGSGKTTLLQTIAGVLHPVQGRVLHIGRVSSLVDLSAGFHRELTGRENLAVGGVLLGLTRAEVNERSDDIVAFTGLPDEILDEPLRTYSAGMGLRLGFAIVAHSEPSVLLVDEVLAVGDEAFQHRCLERIADMRERGCAVIMVSHDLEMVARHADRAVVLHQGEVQFDGAPGQAIGHYLELTDGTPDAQDMSPAALRDPMRHARMRAITRDGYRLHNR
jgi:ABC-type polysaccharide/polyol phosphate transport system ATPase subunit